MSITGWWVYHKQILTWSQQLVLRLFHISKIGAGHDGPQGVCQCDLITHAEKKHMHIYVKHQLTSIPRYLDITPALERPMEPHLSIVIESFKVVTFWFLPALWADEFHTTPSKKDSIRITSPFLTDCTLCFCLMWLENASMEPLLECHLKRFLPWVIFGKGLNACAWLVQEGRIFN